VFVSVHFSVASTMKPSEQKHSESNSPSQYNFLQGAPFAQWYGFAQQWLDIGEDGLHTLRLTLPSRPWTVTMPRSITLPWGRHKLPQPGICSGLSPNGVSLSPRFTMITLTIAGRNVWLHPELLRLLHAKNITNPYVWEIYQPAFWQAQHEKAM
jgi:hypothetical protein